MLLPKISKNHMLPIRCHQPPCRNMHVNAEVRICRGLGGKFTCGCTGGPGNSQKLGMICGPIGTATTLLGSESCATRAGTKPHLAVTSACFSCGKCCSHRNENRLIATMTKVTISQRFVGMV